MKEGGKQDGGENLVDNLDYFLTTLFLQYMLRKGNHVGNLSRLENIFEVPVIRPVV